jgi:hypothetical protein
MSNFAVVDGDTVTFDASSFAPAATVTTKPGTISGTGSKLQSGAKVCVAGDEGSVSVKGVSYQTLTFTTAGSGTLSIASLGSDQTAQKLTVDTKKVILVGTKFNATFTVVTPASVTVGTVTTMDKTATYSGTGEFVTGNTKLNSA